MKQIRFVCILCAAFFLHCMGTSYADTRVAPGNPKYWDESCKNSCKDPMVIEMIEMGTGRKYIIKVAPLSLTPPRGCECVKDKQYINESVSGAK